MRTHHRIIILLLIPVIIMTHTAVALAASFAAAPTPDKVTVFKPETMESESVKTAEARSGSSWWKWTLGILLVGGVAAAAGGGGGGGSSPGGGSGGTIDVGW